MFLECLGDSSMRLGVSFIAPRQLGAVGGQQGRLSLPSVGWRTGQPLFMSGARAPSYSGADDRCRFVAVGTPDSPVHHRITTVHVRCAISFLFWRRRPLQIRGSWRTGYCPVHTGQSGAPADRWRGPRVARGLRGRPLRWRLLDHRTVRCTIGQSDKL
jgi:hypothetical protein